MTLMTPETAGAAAAGGDTGGFVFHPWKLKEMRRLYVSRADGTKVGYLDLATLAHVPEAGTGPELLRAALAGLAPGMADPSPAAALPVATASPVLPWQDLAGNRPGQLIEDQQDPSYRAGVAGEQRTAGVLAGLERSGYRVLHSVPLSSRKDIDHLVIGPSGIWAINTKASTYDVTTTRDGAVYADGYRQKWIDSITRDAAVAADHLSRAARMDLTCNPLVAVWSTMTVSSAHPALVSGEDLLNTIGPGGGFPPAWVDVVFNTARRSDTWTAHH